MSAFCAFSSCSYIQSCRLFCKSFQYKNPTIMDRNYCLKKNILKKVLLLWKDDNVIFTSRCIFTLFKDSKFRELATLSKVFEGFLDDGPQFVLRLVVFVLHGIGKENDRGINLQNLINEFGSAVPTKSFCSWVLNKIKNLCFDVIQILFGKILINRLLGFHLSEWWRFWGSLCDAKN